MTCLMTSLSPLTIVRIVKTPAVVVASCAGVALWSVFCRNR